MAASKSALQQGDRVVLNRFPVEEGSLVNPNGRPGRLVTVQDDMGYFMPDDMGGLPESLMGENGIAVFLDELDHE